MATETITFEIDSDTARAFESVSEEQRAKLQILLGIWLQEFSRSESSLLQQTMDEISRNAKGRGLTPEILESILRQD
jgi:hypothetical protein